MGDRRGVWINRVIGAGIGLFGVLTICRLWRLSGSGHGRVALVELDVDLSGSSGATIGERVLDAIRNAAEERHRRAVEAISASARAGARIIVCPGWTFVGEEPPAEVRRVAGKTTVVCETVSGDSPSVVPRILERGLWRKAAPQVAATGTELDQDAYAEALVEALEGGSRRVGEDLLLICGENNLVTRGSRDPGTGELSLRPSIVEKGLQAEALSRWRMILNPVHTPIGGYTIDQQNAGPWQELVSVGNTFDPMQLPDELRKNRVNRPRTARRASKVGGELPPPLEGQGWRVYVFDVS